jgi:apolipoprotein N-acyltransferase
VRAILDARFALSDEALSRGPLDLLLWPETVYPTTFGAPKSEAGADFDREIGAFVASRAVPLVFGAYDVEDAREFKRRCSSLRAAARASSSRRIARRSCFR